MSKKLPEFDLGTASTADLMVYADWLEDHNIEAIPTIIRHIADELEDLDLSLERRESNPTWLRLVFYEESGSYLIWWRKRGQEALEFHEGATHCGTFARSSNLGMSIIADIFARRYSFPRFQVSTFQDGLDLLFFEKP